MRTLHLTLLAAALVAAGAAAVAAPKVVTSRRTEKVTLQEAGAFDDEKHVVAEFGETVKMKAKLYVGDFLGKKVVYANGKATNTGKEPRCFHYYLSLHDEEGRLLGAAGQGSFGDEGLKPGEDENLGSMLVPLPHAAVEKIARYRIVFYEGKQEIGKE